MEILPLIIIFAFIVILFSPEEKSDKEPDEEYDIEVKMYKKKKEDKD